MEISRCITASALEEINIGTLEAPQHLLIVEDLPPPEKVTVIDLLHKYKDVFAWSHKHMKGLDPKFYQHYINLVRDVKPVQQQHYHLNPNYTERVNEEINKLLKIRFIKLVN